MKFKRIQALWRADKSREGSTEEPSEALFRKWVLAIAMLVIPPLMLFVYYKTMFPGLTNPDALDYAQLGRNMSVGRGFVTFILRPLALAPGHNPLAQPDVTHGPLYPFLLALAFAAAGAKDSVAALVSGLFYLLTIPVVYFLGVRVFNRGVGLLAALIVTFNALLLEYAVSGLPITLYVFLTTCLLYAMYTIAARSGSTAVKQPKGPYMLAGVLTALLYLTDPIFFWLVPFLIASVYVMAPGRKLPALTALLLPMAVLMLPWMVRNTALTGNPVFGLRGMEIWMFTKGHYPGYDAYRQYPSEIIPGIAVFQAVVKKILLGTGQIIQAFPQVTASWVLAFFLPCLLFRFSDAATNSLRRVMMLCLLGLVVGSLIFHVQMPVFVAIIPTMLVFSVAYLLHLTQQAKLRSGSLALLAGLMVFAIGLPLLSQMVLIDKTHALKEMSAAGAMNRAMQTDEIALSDQPWIVAWYADRPAIWAPVIDTRIGDLRTQFNKMRWLFLTENARTLSPEWAAIYEVSARWASTNAQALVQNKPIDSGRYTDLLSQYKFPLLTALGEYEIVAQAKDANSSVIVAVIPNGNQIGMRSAQNGSTGH